MTVKLAMIVLALVLLAGAIGKRIGAAGGRRGRPRRPAVEAARKCPTCGDWVMEGARCLRPGCAADRSGGAGG